MRFEPNAEREPGPNEGNFQNETHHQAAHDPHCLQAIAVEQKISEERALQIGLKKKAKEFVEKCAEVYVKP